MNKADLKLQKIAGKLLELIASDAYASGEGFEYLLAEQDIGDCVDRLPLPHKLQQVRGAIYQSKGANTAKARALWIVTSRASLSPKLSDEVARYILSCSDVGNIAKNLQDREDLSDAVRENARQLAISSNPASS